MVCSPDGLSGRMTNTLNWLADVVEKGEISAY
jgi:hypothetical protein